MIRTSRGYFRQLVVLCLALALSAACARAPRVSLETRPTAFVARDDATAFSRHAPVFVVRGFEQTYNRIGAPAARMDGKGRERVFIDPQRPVFFAQEVKFRASGREYTNLVYRVHFERVPFPDLTAGKNVGLLALITLNAGGEPVLITTVHTCGCYKAMIPTTYLPPENWPEKWDPTGQEVYGENLPGILAYPSESAAGYRPVIFVRPETHRIMDVRIENVREAAWRYEVVPAAIEPMDNLKALRIDGRTTSFYEAAGGRKGFVKESRKPLEKLFMGTLAFDLNVGCDKEYGDSSRTGTTFYTSLKFWRRQDSDMWQFARFLSYWGWRL